MCQQIFYSCGWHSKHKLGIVFFAVQALEDSGTNSSGLELQHGVLCDPCLKPKFALKAVKTIILRQPLDAANPEPGSPRPKSIDSPWTERRTNENRFWIAMYLYLYIYIWSISV